jgi:hypothetical protein
MKRLLKIKRKKSPELSQQPISSGKPGDIAAEPLDFQVDPDVVHGGEQILPGSGVILP